MSLSLILEMAEAGDPTRQVLGDRRQGYSAAQLAEAVNGAASLLRSRRARHVLYVAPNHLAFAVGLLAAAAAGVPFVPLNYRLADERLRELLANHPDALVLTDAAGMQRLAGAGPAMEVDRFLARAEGAAAAAPAHIDSDDVALLLYTSGTTAAPKAAVIRHRHLTSYIFETGVFGSAAADEAALVAVPPYHIAGVANLLSNLYAGRRVVYLDAFDALTWLERVREERVTHAMLVPTMLARIVSEPAAAAIAVPTLRAISYGGARMPLGVLERALERFPDVAFTNAYGLTETSSTICLLTPEDHRRALASGDPAIQARLGSVGRPLPAVEIRVVRHDGSRAACGERGMIEVRGAQVSGEYVDARERRPGDWFPTGDDGRLDRDGYLFVDGRADDTIIRGGENIAACEIEDAISLHPHVASCAVVGLPDDEWGQLIAAVVVARPGSRVEPDELREWVRARLRGSKVPDRVELRASLPQTSTGKVLRRVLVSELSAATPPG